MINLDEYDFIPLLSKKPLYDFTPQEFKQYVKSLYHKPVPKKSAPKRKKERDKKVTARMTKKKGLSFTTRREPKYVTEAEMSAFAETTGTPENELFIALREKGFAVWPSHEAAEEVKKVIAELPF